MASRTAKGSGSTNNNGGTVIGGGSYDSSGPITNDLKVKDLNVNGVYGSQLVEAAATADDYTDPNGLIKAKSSGTFAYNPDYRAGERNIIARAAGTASAGKINGVASNILNTPGAEFAGNPRGQAHTTSGSEKLGNPTWTYPMLPGSGRVPGLTESSGTGDSYTFVSTTDGTADGLDKNISHTKAVPGEVTYRTGSPVATTTNMKARDSAET